MSNEAHKTLYQPVIYQASLIAPRDWNGWVEANQTFTYSSADDPTYVVKTPGDYTSYYSPGMRFKCVQVISTMKAQYKFDTGALTTDSSGQTHTLTAIGGGGSEVTAKFGTGVSLASASSQAYSATDHADFKPTGAFTVGAWIKTTTTGVVQTIFQSQSTNTSVAGFKLRVGSDNFIGINSGKNTGTVVGTDFQQALSTTNVTDGKFHFVVGTSDGTNLKIYVDGRLEATTAWANNPAYAATNYVRSGCGNATGTDTQFFNGTIDDVFLLNGTALTEGEINNIFYTGSATSTGIPKNFIITAPPVYDGTDTYLTLYGGTDFDLANATIFAPHFSHTKAPQGFILNPAKWSTTLTDTSNRSQATPTAATWYNLGSLSLAIPVGIWDLSYQVALRFEDNASNMDLKVTMSTANNSQSDSSLTTMFNCNITVAATGGVTIISLTKSKVLNLLSKTTYYLNAITSIANTIAINFRGDLLATVITARCAYL